MARGDVVVFNDAKGNMLESGWEAADIIRCAVLDNTTAPGAGTTNPALGTFTQIETAGSYTAGGSTLGTLSTLVGDSLGGTMTFDSAVNPTWAQNASNGIDAYWAVIYNDTDPGDLAIAYVDLGGPVDMTAGDLTITWNASGIFTIT